MITMCYHGDLIVIDEETIYLYSNYYLVTFPLYLMRKKGDNACMHEPYN